MHAKRLLLAAPISTVLAVVGALVSPAAGSALMCGASVTHDLVLHSDLIGCTGNGLVVAADGIRIDLAGHRISGDGVPGAATFDSGVLVSSHHDVVITGGTISGFDRGVRLEQSNHDTLSHLILDANARTGTTLFATDDSVVNDVVARGSSVGVLLTGASRRDRVHAVTALLNEQGITIDGATHIDLLGNRLSRNGDNVIVGGSDNRILSNTITDAVGCGPDCGGHGISLESGSRNLLADNTITGTVLDGIRIGNFDAGNPTDQNVLRGNAIRSAGRDGISVGTDSQNSTSATLIDDNTVVRATANGYHVADAGTRLTKNIANRNGLHGIDAVLGVIDGGGNRADGNGAAPACLNVTCR